MKNLILAVLVMAGSSALAHGSRAEQAADAVRAAVEHFEQQPEQVQKQFESVTAVRTGHEQFDVVISLTDKSMVFTYACVENETVEPVVWDCVIK